MKPIEARAPRDAERFCALQGASPLSPQALHARGADAHWMMIQGGQVHARCSLWWTHVPPPLQGGQRLGLVGHYAADDFEAGCALLELAGQQLVQRGCTHAIGPMDGSTWHGYRLVSERGSERPFFLEPWHPPDWPAQFEVAEFEALFDYFSALNAQLQPNPRLPELDAKAREQGIRLRPLAPDRFEDELRRIHRFSIASFQKNPLYSSITFDAFLALYLPIQAHLRPELVTLAEQDGALVGYQFSIPDLLQAQREGRADSAIIKTVAVDPKLGGAGLGSLLVAHAHEAIRQAGFKRAIHALMYEDNLSRKISAHTATVMRRYTLYAKAL